MGSVPLNRPTIGQQAQSNLILVLVASQTVGRVVSVGRETRER
jgi:hypothetical protein